MFIKLSGYAGREISVRHAWRILALAASFLLTGLSASPALSQQVGTGLLLDDAAYERAPRVAVLMRGDYDNLPKSASLKPYAPFAGNQLNTSMCVGWATGYAARSIIEAQEMGWTDRELITSNAYSPAYIYNRLRSPEDDPQCTGGLYLIWALDLLEEEGVTPISRFPAACERMPTADDELLASDHRIIGYHKLFETDTKKKVLPVRKSLAEGNPVVIGMKMTTSFMNSGHREVWMPAEGEEPDAGAHAMTVIGYDDEKYGGAFEIMNSWGTRWGNEGFIWVPYDAFSDYVYYAFELFGVPEEERTVASLKSKLSLTLASGEPMTATFMGDHYEVDEAYPSFTTFRAHVTNSAPAYVYAFGSDLTRAANRLIPEDPHVSAYLPYQESSISLLPEDSFISLDERTGTDYLTILFSTVELNLTEIVQQMPLEEGSFMERLSTVLGRRLHSPEMVKFSEGGSIGFEADVPGGKVVPLVVEIDHVAKPSVADQQPPQITLLNKFAEAGTNSFVTLEKPLHTSTVTLMGTLLEANGLREFTAAGRPVEVDPDGFFRVDLDITTLSSDTLVVQGIDAAGNRSAVHVVLARHEDRFDAPKISIVEPRVIRGSMRGLKVTSGTRPVSVKGSVGNAAEVEGIYVNGIAADILRGGVFAADLHLPNGDKRLEVKVVGPDDHTTTEVFYILDQGENAEEVLGSPGYRSAEKSFVEVDVFYATDRKRTGSSEPSDFYGGERGTLQYGKTTVSIPKGHRVGEMESPAWWRLEFSEDPSKHITIRRIQPQSKDMLLKGLRAAIGRSRGKEAFVFIHGYNTSFEDAARRTAQLAYDVGFDGAPIMYSWPSDGALFSYAADESDAAWTVPNLQAFLEDVRKNSGASRVHLVAHSMGSRPLADVLTRVAVAAAEPPFGHVIFTAPDIDADIFERDIAPLLPKAARRVTLYASSDDRALIASRKVHGYARAGESGAGLTVSQYLDTIDVSGIDTDLLGHSYFAETEHILRDIYGLMMGNLPPQNRKLVRKAKGVLEYWLLPME